MTRSNRRHFLQGASALGLLSWMPGSAMAQAVPARARAFPLSQVRLTPSPWLDAVQANQRFMMTLEPDRLLARFRENAGLPPKGEVYGGWESDTIAGHTLGHYLSALSLMHAQTGDAECRRRADYIVAELALCQAQSADGYVAALGRRVGDQVHKNGKPLFDEVMQGRIDPRFGNLNGGWAPLYNLHKQLAGLLDAHAHLANAQALAVAAGLAGYIDQVFAKLDERNTQLVLDCEYGGLQESIAELYSRTGQRRWLDLARRLRHDKTFRPAADGRDELDNTHSNTEIPKYVGAARLYEVGGGEDNAAAARFFWRAVTRRRSYVVGGNGDREWFPAGDALSRHITEQTCEHCSTYNMLKITRHLFQWEPDAKWFDYYERAHLNHTLAAQDPGTGMFAYMMPMMAGAKRTWSQPDGQFWCCMGSGMEAHAKHGDSVYWQGGDAAQPVLYVNEFIPSTLDWPGVGAFELKTRYPHGERIELVVTRAAGRRPVSVKLRLPGWAAVPSLTLNGKAVPARGADGYATLSKRLRAGDRIVLTLPMAVYREAAPDHPALQAYLHGPMVLAADLGRDGAPLPPEETPAVFAGGDRPAAQAPSGGVPASAGALASTPAGTDVAYTLTTTTGTVLTLRPFYRQWNQRTAVYFEAYSRQGWAAEAARRAQAVAGRKQVLAATVDLLSPGDPASEAGHACADARTEPAPYRGRSGRLIKTGGGYMEADLRCAARPMTLYVTYWGEAERGLLDIVIDGKLIATQRLSREAPGGFFEAAYLVPFAYSKGKDKVRVRFEPHANTRGPSIYEVRMA
ncbi:glycoside hydrolase family 127 protein [Pseudoduganella sp. LjRoot289]|uniref:beta-L-arabinofuranosidase domain-containing protein n=1 Tax=Pseudoduganella sp. LjRoot289 TaxID=3342314 RepID=UPI003ECC81CD